MTGDSMAPLFEAKAEAERAHRRYGLFNSSHEGFGVLTEEVMELLHAIHGNDLEAMRREAIQVAAVALRLAAHCRDHAEFAERSGT